MQLYNDQWKRVGAARYNLFYWLTFATPATIMLLAAYPIRRLAKPYKVIEPTVQVGDDAREG